AANSQTVFQRVDDFFEAFRGERRSIEQEQREMAQHVTCGVTGKCGMCLHLGEDLVSIVMKNELQQFGERAAIRNLRTKERGSAFAPSRLRGRHVAREPA